MFYDNFSFVFQTHSLEFQTVCYIFIKTLKIAILTPRFKNKNINV